MTTTPSAHGALRAGNALKQIYEKRCFAKQKWKLHLHHFFLSSGVDQIKCQSLHKRLFSTIFLRGRFPIFFTFRPREYENRYYNFWPLHFHDFLSTFYIFQTNKNKMQKWTTPSRVALSQILQVRLHLNDIECLALLLQTSHALQNTLLIANAGDHAQAEDHLVNNTNVPLIFPDRVSVSSTGTVSLEPHFNVSKCPSDYIHPLLTSQELYRYYNTKTSVIVDRFSKFFFSLKAVFM